MGQTKRYSMTMLAIGHKEFSLEVKDRLRSRYRGIINAVRQRQRMVKFFVICVIIVALANILCYYTQSSIRSLLFVGLSLVALAFTWLRLWCHWLNAAGSLRRRLRDDREFYEDYFTLIKIDHGLEAEVNELFEFLGGWA